MAGGGAASSVNSSADEDRAAVASPGVASSSTSAAAFSAAGSASVGCPLALGVVPASSVVESGRADVRKNGGKKRVVKGVVADDVDATAWWSGNSASWKAAKIAITGRKP